jgi:hypothetical protein
MDTIDLKSLKFFHGTCWQDRRNEKQDDYVMMIAASSFPLSPVAINLLPHLWSLG